jgi:spermidine synthase
VFTSETQFHQLVVTQWQKDFWFFIDKLKNICSIDEYLFYEPMVHGALQVAGSEVEVLVLGGENGCLLREVLKYGEVKKIDVVSYDSLLRKLGEQNQYFTRMNKNAYKHPKIHVLSESLLEFVSHTESRYDVIFIDLPDPRSIETNQYYTREFYSFLKKIVKDQGLLITQAGSPYFATEAFYSIGKTIQDCSFNTLPLHNQILTLGEWGWYICSSSLSENEMQNKLCDFEALDVETKWWNREAANLVSSFGKTYSDTLHIGINTLDNPLVYRYYLKGNWNME